jgi:hypothetical protein
MSRNVRGRIIVPVRTEQIGGAVARLQQFGIVVYVKAGSTRMMREFRRFCDYWGIDVAPRGHRFDPEVGDYDSRPDAWECMGEPDALQMLIGHKSIVDWHYIMDAKPPMGAAGSGEVSDRVRKVINRQRLNKPDRLAWEESERRAKLPKDERETIELEEARARLAAL